MRTLVRALWVPLVVAAVLLGCESKSSGEEGKSEENTQAEASGESGGEAAGKSAGSEGSGAAAKNVKMGTETIAEFTADMPEEWTNTPPSSSMRVAQYEMPGADGAEAAELVVYRFKGGAGTKDANIDRWVGQIQIDGQPATRDAASISTEDSNGLNLTVVDISGTYVAAMRPGAPAKNNKPGTRMVAAILEGSGDPLYIKVVGPQETVDYWYDTLMTSLRSFSAK